MNNKFHHIRIVTAVVGFVLAISFIITACKKNEITIPPPQSTFLNISSGIFLVTKPDILDSIKIGVTSVANTDRTVGYSISSPTGAVAGTQYSLVNSTVTIPAGKAIGYLIIKGNFPAYDGTGRKDTLVIKLTGDKNSAIPPSDFSNTYTLFMTAPCKVVLSDYLGLYKHTNEFLTSAYGPYTTAISNVQNLTATTGTITVSNIFNAGWNDITFKLDWSDPLNTTITLDEQSGIADGGTLSSSYNGDDVSVKAIPGKNGTFSSCNQTFTLIMQVGITGRGYFPYTYTVNMAR